MSKTYSFPKVSLTCSEPFERSWESCWSKKFGKGKAPITVPAAVLEAQGAGIELLPAAYSELETAVLRQWYETASLPASIYWGKALSEYLPKDFVAPERGEDLPLSAPTRKPRAKEVWQGPIQPPPPTTVSAYLHKVYDPDALKATIEQLAARIRPYLNDFDAIAFRGSSGAAAAYPLSFLLGKPLMHVRKMGDNSHCSAPVEGYRGARRYIIVDDFVASGTTVLKILQTIEATHVAGGYPPPECVHLFLYAPSVMGKSEAQVRENLPGFPNMKIHLAHV